MDQNWLAQLPIEPVTTFQGVHGGDVNQAFHLHTAKRELFLLVQPGQPASFYAGEIAGLNAFAENGIAAPRVLGNGAIDGDGYLLLSYLASGTGDQAALGHLVAKLHQVQSPTGRFGFEQPYAGTSVSFDNAWTDTWTELFVDRRLDVLDRALTHKGLWTAADHTRYLAARAKIVAALATHKSQPVLLHGDLWSGNFMFTADGQPALIDPAALYGDREFDIGITTVFGGFNDRFYQAYAADLPFEPGAGQRLDFYRLYLLMVHLDKFGSSYARPVASLLSRIVEG
ncbi:fructosamine kinase family protein [Lacticaseibacillus hegangensis]|uniref:Fructosamine kinase family protein n=1 Tax=Lacticaseibacillus hegangensis TaxID=2486010 RepID=A0ABW4CX74_9LACO|nr:fructosamine kinase family protein [Lacticaseibacillus hegangensis]